MRKEEERLDKIAKEEEKIKKEEEEWLLDIDGDVLDKDDSMEKPL